jgi:hypothetical protein
VKIVVILLLLVIAQKAICQEHSAADASLADPQYCSDLWHKGLSYSSSFQFQKEYDTLKAYVEQCPLDPDAFRAFSGTTDAVNGLSNIGDTIWAQYRSWLKKVLYNNPERSYYCSDLMEYAVSFAHPDELGNTPDFKTVLSIFKYLGDSSDCQEMKYQLPEVWKAYHLYWKDTVTDSVKTPLDSTIPTIDEINHAWLRGFKAGINNGNLTSSKDALGNLIAEDNPFTDEVKLKYSLLKSVVTKVEIFDALGKRLWTDGQGYQEIGEHLLKINTTGWPSGTYYARLVTLQGELKTVKIIKK